jgi:hypothetical protein
MANIHASSADRNCHFTELDIRRAFTSFQLMTIMEETFTAS